MFRNCEFKKFCIIGTCVVVLNLTSAFFAWYYMRKVLQAQKDQKINNKIEHPISFVFRTTDESNYEVVADSITWLVSNFPDMPVLVVCENSPYPPLNLTDSKYKNVRILPRESDIRTVMNYTRMVKNIMNSWYYVIVPDSVRVNPWTLNLIIDNYLAHKDSTLMIAITMPNLPKSLGQRIIWDGSVVTYINNPKDTSYHDSVTGNQIIFTTNYALDEINDPFELPFPESLYLQRYFREGKTMIQPCVISAVEWIYKALENKTTTRETEILETKRLQKQRSTFYKKHKIHAVVRDGRVELYGCNRNTPRCFPPVIDKPSYVYEGKRTPHCCFVHMANVAEHVFEVFKVAKVRFWLESVSLVAVLSTGKHNTFADHFEIGIYAEDIARVEHLARGGTDSRGYVWQCATNGHYYIVNLSAINKNNVLILPFVSSNGTMWPDDWKLPHQREFPEWHLYSMKEKYVGDIPYPIPNYPESFVDHKFRLVNSSQKFKKNGMQFMYSES